MGHVDACAQKLICICSKIVLRERSTGEIKNQNPITTKTPPLLNVIWGLPKHEPKVPRKELQIFSWLLKSNRA